MVLTQVLMASSACLKSEEQNILKKGWSKLVSRGVKKYRVAEDSKFHLISFKETCFSVSPNHLTINIIISSNLPEPSLPK